MSETPEVPGAEVQGAAVQGTDVLALGETMGQFVPVDGSIAHASSFSLEHAGAESNVAVGMARLGLRAAWVSRLGTDALGDRILSALAPDGVDTTLVTRDAMRPTGLFLKDPSGLARTVTYYRSGSAASALSRSDVDRALAARPRVLHLSGITPALSASCDDAVEYALRAAREAGITTSFDVNFRPALWSNTDQAAARLAELARLSDIVFVGLDEAETLWSLSTPDAVAALLQPGTRLVVKNGGVAASAHAQGVSHTVPALAVDVVESVGAGDAFAAGWLAAFVRGLDDEMRLRCGHLLARNALLSLGDHGAPIAWNELLRDAQNPDLWAAHGGPSHDAQLRGVEHAHE